MYAIATLMNKDGTYDSVGTNNRRPITGLKTQKGIIRNVDRSVVFKGRHYKIEFFPDSHSNQEMCHMRYYSTPKAALGEAIPPVENHKEVIRGMGPHCLQCDAEMSPHAQVYTVTDKPTGKTKGWVHVECRDEYENIVAYEKPKLKDEYALAKKELNGYWEIYVKQAKAIGESYEEERLTDFAEWLSIELNMSPE